MLLFSVPAYAQVDDPVLLTVDGKEIKRSEFEYAFNKNNSNLVDGKQTAEEAGALPVFFFFFFFFLALSKRLTLS